MAEPASEPLPPGSSGAASRPGLVDRVRASAEGAPTTVVAAAALTVLEALALVGYAVAYPFEVLPLGDDAGTKALIAGGVILFLLIAAAGLAAAAFALLALKRWSLSLIVVTQLVAIPVLLPAARGDVPVLWLAIGVAAVVLVLAFLPPTTAAVKQ